MKILLKPVLVIVLAVLCQYGYAAGNETGESPMAKVLKAGKKTRTGYSTDAETLEKLKEQHDIIPAILAWRKVSKLKSTYTDGLTKTIDADGRIRSTFHQTVTATGRSTCLPQAMIPALLLTASTVRQGYTGPAARAEKAATPVCAVRYSAIPVVNSRSPIIRLPPPADTWLPPHGRDRAW